MPLQFVVAVPVADVAGNPPAVSVPASPATLFDKIDEYPNANDSDYFWGGGTDPLSGLYGFVLDPAALAGIPGGWHIAAVEAVARLYSPEQGTDQLDRVDVTDAGSATTGQSAEGPLLNQGWGTYILPIERIGGGAWLSSDLARGFIGLFDFTRGVQVGQFYFRYYIAKPHGADPSSTAPAGAPSTSAPAGAPAGSAPSGAASSTAQAGAPASTAAGAGATTSAQAAAPASTSPAGLASPIDDCTAAPLASAPGAAPSSSSPTGMPSDQSPAGDAS